MNNPKNQNLKINKKSSKKSHYLQRKKIQKKSSIENLNNLFVFPNNKDLYRTIVIKKTSSKFHSKPKKSEKKSSCCIKSGKTFKSASKFKNPKDIPKPISNYIYYSKFFNEKITLLSNKINEFLKSKGIEKFQVEPLMLYAIFIIIIFMLIILCIYGGKLKTKVDKDKKE